MQQGGEWIPAVARGEMDPSELDEFLELLNADEQTLYAARVITSSDTKPEPQAEGGAEDRKIVASLASTIPQAKGVRCVDLATAAPKGDSSASTVRVAPPATSPRALPEASSSQRYRSPSSPTVTDLRSLTSGVSADVIESNGVTGYPASRSPDTKYPGSRRPPASPRFGDMSPRSTDYGRHIGLHGMENRLRRILLENDVDESVIHALLNEGWISIKRFAFACKPDEFFDFAQELQIEGDKGKKRDLSRIQKSCLKAAWEDACAEVDLDRKRKTDAALSGQASPSIPILRGHASPSIPGPHGNMARQQEMLGKEADDEFSLRMQPYVAMIKNIHQEREKALLKVNMNLTQRVAELGVQLAHFKHSARGGNQSEVQSSPRSEDVPLPTTSIQGVSNGDYGRHGNLSLPPPASSGSSVQRACSTRSGQVSPPPPDRVALGHPTKQTPSVHLEDSSSSRDLLEPATAISRLCSVRSADHSPLDSPRTVSMQVSCNTSLSTNGAPAQSSVPHAYSARSEGLSSPPHPMHFPSSAGVCTPPHPMHCASSANMLPQTPASRAQQTRCNLQEQQMSLLNSTDPRITFLTATTSRTPGTERMFQEQVAFQSDAASGCQSRLQSGPGPVLRSLPVQSPRPPQRGGAPVHQGPVLRPPPGQCPQIIPPGPSPMARGGSQQLLQPAFPRQQSPVRAQAFPRQSSPVRAVSPNRIASSGAFTPRPPVTPPVPHPMWFGPGTGVTRLP